MKKLAKKIGLDIDTVTPYTTIIRFRWVGDVEKKRGVPKRKLKSLPKRRTRIPMDEYFDNVGF